MNPSIHVTEASVTYRIRHGASTSLKGTLINAVKRRSHDVDVKALRNVSLSVYPGEVLAVIGGNGAGKSTLLKLIARVLPPTTGRVIVNGSVAPMIELGAGFNSELTGRENIMLYGTLLGRSSKALKTRCDEIAEWAGLTDFIDLPVRTYSSGMVARLAFSIATEEKSDVILIDEVLSVGDADFQLRSKERMDKLITSGSAVVLVTHSLETVKELATKAMWLNRGEVLIAGDSKTVIDEYMRSQH